MSRLLWAFPGKPGILIAVCPSNTTSLIIRIAWTLNSQPETGTTVRTRASNPVPTKRLYRNINLFPVIITSAWPSGTSTWLRLACWEVFRRRASPAPLLNGQRQPVAGSPSRALASIIVAPTFYWQNWSDVLTDSFAPVPVWVVPSRRTLVLGCLINVLSDI